MSHHSDEGETQTPTTPAEGNASTSWAPLTISDLKPRAPEDKAAEMSSDSDSLQEPRKREGKDVSQQTPTEERRQFDIFLQ